MTPILQKYALLMWQHEEALIVKLYVMTYSIPSFSLCVSAPSLLVDMDVSWEFSIS